MGYNDQKKNQSLNQYETVKSRKTRLRLEYPDSVILPIPLSDLNYVTSYVLMGALIWKDRKQFESVQFENVQKLAEGVTPQNAGLVMASIAIQTNADSSGFSLSIAGGKGADRTSWVENAEESAVGRALDNMGYHSGSASKEEMEKIQYMLDLDKQRVMLENDINSTYTELIGKGLSDQQLGQIISQAVKQPFRYLTELSIQELEKLLGDLKKAGGPNNNHQPPQSPPNNLPPVGSPAPPVSV